MDDDFIINSFDGPFRFLSNFYPAIVEYKGIEYPSVENAYQAAKFKDENIRKNFVQCTALVAKRKARYYIRREDWEDVKVTVMAKLLADKFLHNKYDTTLADSLIATGSAQLVEGNTWGDKFWGVCNGEGQNMLGVLLMQTRDRLRAARGMRR